LALDQDGVDPGLVQQLPEQQPGRAAANDGDLGVLNLHTFSAQFAADARAGSGRLGQ
jgi:hypothetical protein